MKNVIDNIGPLSSRGIRAGVVVYSDEASIRIRFDDHYGSNSFKSALDRLAYDGKATRIDLGLKVSKELFYESNGGRGSSKKVNFIIV